MPIVPNCGTVRHNDSIEAHEPCGGAPHVLHEIERIAAGAAGAADRNQIMIEPTHVDAGAD